MRDKTMITMQRISSILLGSGMASIGGFCSGNCTHCFRCLPLIGIAALVAFTSWKSRRSEGDE